MNKSESCIVIGGGIVGLATAWTLLQRQPNCQVVVLEKEDRIAAHQTGRNSNVIHAGVYYAPGSLKAKLCRAGLEATKAFCEEHGLPYQTPGKLIVATELSEIARLDELEARARQNDLDLRRIGHDELREIEPHIRGIDALLVKQTGITAYTPIALKLAELIRQAGGEIRLGQTVHDIREYAASVTVVTNDGEITADRLVACAGLQSDRIARLAGLDVEHRIVPFRGEYFRLPDSRKGLVRHLIYPVPDPSLPFLGVHLTLEIDGGITLGPNAVLGLAREGYTKWSLDWRDAADTLAFPGLWKALSRFRNAAATELRNSALKRGYLKACQRYCPSLNLDDMQPHPTGIRAQAVSRTGEMIHDFLFLQTRRMLHVCNAPSPAATSALPIAAMICCRLAGAK
jgi:L-2-hydroxyglutarate oxidase